LFSIRTLGDLGRHYLKDSGKEGLLCKMESLWLESEDWLVILHTTPLSDFYIFSSPSSKLFPESWRGVM
jgi:hypothetical protein